MPLRGSGEPDDRYLREKLNAAVSALATSAAPIQERLLSAWIGALGRLEPQSFGDDDERNLFERIYVATSKISASADVGQVPASTEAMSDQIAEGVASEIVALRAAVYRRSLGG